jgi:5-methylcytosine-specific restriction endonuclease McrA
MKARYQADPAAGAARTREYYEANADRVKAHAREYYQRNAEADRERSRKWRAANPNRQKELADRWRDANRARIKAYNSTYYAENRESEIARCLAYTKAHPEVDAAIKQRRNARKRDVVCEHGLGCVTAKFLKAIRAADCLYCAAPGGKGHADHFIPLSRGGLHCVENIVPACVRCNTSKHAMDPHDWLAGLKRSA